jgi:DNA-nicking Smr family endonuclease
MVKKPAEDVGNAQWRRITATVKPIRKIPPSALAGKDREGCELARSGTLKGGAAPSDSGVAPPPFPRLARQQAAKPSLSSPARGEGGTAAAQTLDGGWDRRIRTGRLDPDLTIDLHGHNLASAHTHLARALDRAIGQGARVVLLIAGKQRGPDEAPRGAIRRELESWLAYSRHAGRIVAVRNAHPRHGGAGALYLVLRR